MMYRSKVVLAWGVGLALAACGESKGADPGGMGAGRPDRPQAEETPATEILQHPTPGYADSSNTPTGAVGSAAGGAAGGGPGAGGPGGAQVGPTPGGAAGQAPNTSAPQQQPQQ